MIPKSLQFEDVYFSALDGLAETRHVFLAGNRLMEKWSDNKYDINRFVIGETGFGTGLNFLAAWKLFEDTAPPDAHLTFISFEKFPLFAQEISGYLHPWQGEFNGRLEELAARYPQNPSGTYEIEITPRVKLHLIFDDVNTALPQLNTKVDAWFLDGFKPSSNPDMWSETVFENMARLSKPGASFATFTSAGAVRRGLQAVGFAVEKVPGFGRKREMLTGAFAG